MMADFWKESPFKATVKQEGLEAPVEFLFLKFLAINITVGALLIFSRRTEWIVTISSSN